MIKNNKSDAIQNAAANKINDPNSISDNGFGIDDGTQAGAPVLTSAVVSGNTLIVTGTLSSTPNTTFSVEFFGGTDLDPTGSAEGQQWLGTVNITTDVNGNASFQIALNSIFGTYVTATATSANGGTSDFSNTVTVSGAAQTAAVGGNVWDDANADGLPDNGETGVANVNVQLFTALGNLVASTTTDANGNYNFSSVAPGTYYLQFTAPSGYFFTPPYQGDDTIASHADPTTGQTEQFTLIAGEVDPYYNAGLIPNTFQEPTTTAIDTTENPSHSGDQITFTATVTRTDSVPLGGNVTFEDGSTVLATVALTSDSSGYQAWFTTSALSVGNHTITAIYNGDGFHTSSSASLTQTVQQGLSFTTVTSSNNPALVRQPVTLTASVRSVGGTPTGTVTFYDGSTELDTAPVDANGNATFMISTLAAGNHNISAVYSGDSNFSGSSGSLTQVISQETSDSVSLFSSANPSTLNQPVTFTATVSGNNGTPTGSVTFMDGDTLLGTVPLDANGNATFATSTLTLGSHTITAIYGGDANYASNSTWLTQTVYQGATYTSVSSNINPAQPGQTVTFTASVSSFGSTIPTGTVTFYDGTTALNTVPLDANGNATYTTSSLSIGYHTLTAVYSGDNTFASSSTWLTQTVAQSYALTSVSSNINPAQPGQTITFTANVFSFGSTMPTGTVTFYDGTTALSTVPLDANGNATYATASLSVGYHTITVIYSGDRAFASNSGSLIQTVGQPSNVVSITSLNASVNPSLPGQSVTLTATVSGQSGTPTGTVTFLDGTTVLNTAPLDANGNATFTTSSLALGLHDITAFYSGDGTYASSVDYLTQTVSQAGSSISVSSSVSPSLPG